MGVPRFSFIAAKPGEREHKLKTRKGYSPTLCVVPLPCIVYPPLIHSACPVLAILYVIGLVGFAVSVVPATNPAMYNSELWAAASA